MTKDPWTDPDPQPGDFDAELASIDPHDVEYHRGNPNAKLRVLVGVYREDAEQLERIALARGKRPGSVVAELIRETAHGRARRLSGSS